VIGVEAVARKGNRMTDTASRIRWLGRPGLLLFGLATLLGLIEGLQVKAGAQMLGVPISVPRAITSTLPSWYVHALLVPPTWWLAARYRFERGRVAQALAVLVPAGALYSVVAITASFIISDVLIGALLLGVEVPMTIGRSIVRFLMLYFTLAASFFFTTVAAWYVYEFRRRAQEQRSAADALAMRAAQLEASLARANLETLRMQLNPHFLFNTLNSISVLALKGEGRKVVRMLARLSDLLRLSLESPQQEVTLAEELEVLDHYVEIERVRFADRLSLVRDVDPAALTAHVPSMLLQPIVENALRHGLGRKPGPGEIRIEAAIRGRRLEIIVRDTGPGFQSGASDGGSGLGLTNTRARLRQLYGDSARLTFWNAEAGGAVVFLALPARHSPTSETERNERTEPEDLEHEHSYSDR
jgi:two-component system, LytTR family, sensor kinase